MKDLIITMLLIVMISGWWVSNKKMKLFHANADLRKQIIEQQRQHIKACDSGYQQAMLILEDWKQVFESTSTNEEWEVSIIKGEWEE